MQWDLGVQGVGLLVGMSLAFGVAAQVVVGRRVIPRLWLPSAVAYFLGGLFTSEVWFGWATEEDLQPNVDGLSFDEVLLFAMVPGVATVLIARLLEKRRRQRSINSEMSRPGSSGQSVGR